MYVCGDEAYTDMQGLREAPGGFVQTFTPHFSLFFDRCRAMLHKASMQTRLCKADKGFKGLCEFPLYREGLINTYIFFPTDTAGAPQSPSI